MALDSERWLFFFSLNNYLSCTMNITEKGIFLPTLRFYLCSFGDLCGNVKM